MKKILFIMIILLLTLVNAQDYTIKDAQNCINDSEKIIQELEQNNFSTQRLNNINKESQIFLQSQIQLQEKSIGTDVSLIMKNCDEIRSIQNLAYESSDSFLVLEGFYQEMSKEIDLSQIQYKMNTIKQEIKNERYEKVEELVDQIYEEIIEIKASSTTLNIFYETATKTIKSFLIKNWKKIVITFLITLIFFLIFYKTFKIKKLKRKMKKLEIRKESLKGLLRKNQDDYFNKNIISASLFHIKNKKLSELVRDIDRQVPLIYEKMEKAKRK